MFPISVRYKTSDNYCSKPKTDNDDPLGPMMIDKVYQSFVFRRMLVT